MLNIIAQAAEPIRMFPTRSFSLNLGQVVSLREEGSDIVCFPSDGIRPFGIVVGLELAYGMVAIQAETAILETNFFEARYYQSGEPLFSNNEGYLTNRRIFRNSIPLGSVIKGPDETSPYLEFGLI